MKHPALATSVLCAAALSAGCDFEDTLWGKVAEGPGFETSARAEVESLPASTLDDWDDADDLIGPKDVTTATVAGGKVYVFADGTQRAVRFDPAAARGSQWQALPDRPIQRFEAMAVAVSTTVVVVSGVDRRGDPIDKLEWLDGSSANPTAWNVVDLAFARSDMAVAVAGDKVYMFGGRDEAGDAVDSIAVFDAKTRQVTSLAETLPFPRAEATAFFLDGKIHVFGGRGLGSSLPLASDEIFDVAAEAVVATLQTSKGRVEPQVVVVGRKALMIGSRTRSDGADRVDIYDADLDRWLIGPDLPRGYDMPALATSGGRAFVAGGRDDERSRRDVYVFDFAANRWSDADPLPTPRHAAFAAEIGGRTYVIGGILREEDDFEVDDFI